MIVFASFAFSIYSDFLPCHNQKSFEIKQAQYKYSALRNQI